MFINDTDGNYLASDAAFPRKNIPNKGVPDTVRPAKCHTKRLTSCTSWLRLKIVRINRKIQTPPILANFLVKP